MIDVTHVHPMIVDFPLALVPVAAGLQLYALARGEPLFGSGWPGRGALVLLAVAAVAARAAAGFGDVAIERAFDAGAPREPLETHEELDFTSAWLLVALAAVQSWLAWRGVRSPAVERGAVAATVVVTALLVITAWFGGHLVYDLGINVARPG